MLASDRIGEFLTSFQGAWGFYPLNSLYNLAINPIVLQGFGVLFLCLMDQKLAFSRHFNNVFSFSVLQTAWIGGAQPSTLLSFKSLLSPCNRSSGLL